VIPRGKGGAGACKATAGDRSGIAPPAALGTCQPVKDYNAPTTATQACNAAKQERAMPCIAPVRQLSVGTYFLTVSATWAAAVLAVSAGLAVTGAAGAAGLAGVVALAGCLVAFST